MIQLDRLGKSESIEAVLVNQHLDDLGRKRFPEIARAMNLTVTDLLPGFIVADKGAVVRLAQLQGQGFAYLRP